MENEADVAAFKDYQPPSEDDVLSTVDTSETVLTIEETSAVTPPVTSTTQTSASTQHVPISLSPQATDKVLASPYARRLAAEKGINLKVDKFNLVICTELGTHYV